MADSVRTIEAEGSRNSRIGVHVNHDFFQFPRHSLAKPPVLRGSSDETSLAVPIWLIEVVHPSEGAVALMRHLRGSMTVE